MNKDKVYLKGHVVGRAVDTLGYEGLMVQLENLDIVEIDKNLVHKDINEPQKPVVLQFVADWYEEHKDDLEISIFHYVNNINKEDESAFKRWFVDSTTKPFQILVNMHQFGYKIKKEKKYLVKMLGLADNLSYLNYCSIDGEWSFNDDFNGSVVVTHHTKKQLEEAGFSNVFDNPMFVVKEIE